MPETDTYYYVIYKTTNLINGKFYIGQHKCRKKFSKDSYYGSGIKLKAAINKYGKSNFKKEILGYCLDSETAREMEESFIKRYDACNPQIGYNLSFSGYAAHAISWLKENDLEKYELFRKRLSNYFATHDVKHSEESKRKMSIAQKNVKHGKASKECCEKHRKAALKQWKTMSEKTILERNKKISESLKGRTGRKWTKEQISRRTETRRKNGWNKRDRK